MTDKVEKSAILCILDGWGLAPDSEYNAVSRSKTPVFDRIWSTYAKTELKADGPDVGLPEGQFGNSEVGHLNIGAGRVVLQDLPRITQAFEKGIVADKENFQSFVAKLKARGGRAHLAGLCSNGGVHAHINHIEALAECLNEMKLTTVLHLITDGRDTPPDSAGDFVSQVEERIKDWPYVSVGTVSGRFYTMDRDQRWDRTMRAFEALAHGRGHGYDCAMTAVRQAQEERDESDEFISPSVIGDYSGIASEDGLIFANFRADRARQILNALVLEKFDSFERGDWSPVRPALGMVPYSDHLAGAMDTLFEPLHMTGLLGEAIEQAGLKQMRMAETEKYPHVTYFLNGGEERPFHGEARAMVPSPDVKTYDLRPEMSAVALTDQVISVIKGGHYALVVINFANADMVGHTGDIPATITACETVDHCLGRLLTAAETAGAVVAVTSDHGNADQMRDPETGRPHTAHTSAPVPFVLVGEGFEAEQVKLRDHGRLADIAPTLLKILKITQPEAMTGHNLILTKS